MYFVFDNKLCKFEGMTKEEIYAAIVSATGNVPEGIDDAFITKIKEINHDGTLQFWRGTAAEYDQIETKDPNVFYIVTDDTTIQDIETDIENMEGQIAGISDRLPALDGSLDGFIRAMWVDYDVYNIKHIYGVALEPGLYLAVYKYRYLSTSDSDHFYTAILYFNGELESRSSIDSNTNSIIRIKTDGYIRYSEWNSNYDRWDDSENVYGEIYVKKLFAPLT